MISLNDLLIPSPQQCEETGDVFVLPKHVDILIDGTAVPGAGGADPRYPIALRLKQALADHGVASTVTMAGRGELPSQASIVLRVDPSQAMVSQGYRLTVMPERIEIACAGAPGLFYGVATLAQLVTLCSGEGALPGVEIVDWPDFLDRGVMLDVSRDRVPTMDTLYALVDLLAGWKVNQLQLYMEHTFAYRGHEVVWAEASPFTGEEILALDAYCRARYIELVPNQNSFGHMHRWMVHEPYRQLAEVPEGISLWPGAPKEPFSLCPTDPGAKVLLADLYDQLLPHFGSRLFNVGLDETFDLGKGRSAQLCAERGTERVYLNFLKEIYALVSERGRTMQFWGDIILHEPDLIPELPSDAIALEWGYDADHPFLEHTRQFADAGLAFYVCPGTSSWNTIAGRTENALRNIASAAQNGKQAGAIGLLNTDWGDNGHLQPLPVSYLGFMAGAAASWNAGTDLLAADFAALLDRYVFRDAAGVMGRVAYDLGNVYRLPGVTPGNASILFYLLLGPDHSLDEGYFAGLTADGLKRTAYALAEIRARLGGAEMACADADLVVEEFALAADLLLWAARLGLARLVHGARDTAASLPEEVRAIFAAALRELIARHRSAWLRRSRPGGLVDSAARLERVLGVLET